VLTHTAQLEFCDRTITENNRNPVLRHL
jgi:hypothetical protein